MVIDALLKYVFKSDTNLPVMDIPLRSKHVCNLVPTPLNDEPPFHDKPPLLDKPPFHDKPPLNDKTKPQFSNLCQHRRRRRKSKLDQLIDLEFERLQKDEMEFAELQAKLGKKICRSKKSRKQMQPQEEIEDMFGDCCKECDETYNSPKNAFGTINVEEKYNIEVNGRGNNTEDGSVGCVPQNQVGSHTLLFCCL